jgi:hypothetical protein
MKVTILVIVLIVAVVTVLCLRRNGRPNEPKDGFVNVYDFQTKKTSTIPAAELAPGMVRVKLERGEVVWAKASDLKQGALRHPPFEGEVRDLVIQIQKGLEEVYPQTYEFWEDGFRRDANAEREIALWLHISRIHGDFVKSRDTNLKERKEAFQVLIACSTGSEETALQTVHLSSLSQSDARGLIAKFFHGDSNKGAKP